MFVGLSFGSVETNRKSQLRCTYQMAAVKALEFFIFFSVECCPVEYQLVVSLVFVSFGEGTVQRCEGFGARLEGKLR